MNNNVAALKSRILKTKNARRNDVAMPIPKNNPIDRQTIQADVLDMIDETTSEWENRYETSIGPETYLGDDLAFKSIDLVRLVTAIQQRYTQKLLPFQDLFMDGDKVRQDIQVSEIVEFLLTNLNNHG